MAQAGLQVLYEECSSLVNMKVIGCGERLRRSWPTRLEGAKYDFYSSSWELLVSFTAGKLKLKSVSRFLFLDF